jgi:hypothetical protein
MKDCPHTPHCGEHYTRWRCAMRTDYERAVERGEFKREQIESLFKKYGIPITPPSRVFKGEKPKLVKGADLFRSDLG